jgi:hypothetical protein
MSKYLPGYGKFQAKYDKAELNFIKLAWKITRLTGTNKLLIALKYTDKIRLKKKPKSKFQLFTTFGHSTAST